MIKEELYHKTVDILVKAYFDDTLKHGNCVACAVGNIINHYRPFTSEEKTNLQYRISGWSSVFCTLGAGHPDQEQVILPRNYKGDSKEQIDSTGYTWQELAKIEFYFETAPQGKSEDEWMFNGLMAVIDVLDEIHENKDTKVTADSKRKFVPAIN